MKNIVIYTDGACSGNPGVGGWGAILVYGGYKKEFCGGEIRTTNNRMELYAAVSALSALKEPCAVELYSDSAYLVNAFNEGWIEKWRENGFKKSDGKDVLNADLWQSLIKLLQTHSVRFKKVKGHADDPMNNRADELARKGIAELKMQSQR